MAVMDRGRWRLLVVESVCQTAAFGRLFDNDTDRVLLRFECRYY